MSDTPTTPIEFRRYTQNLSPAIPIAIQQATGQFFEKRNARVAELPEWELLRDVGHRLRLHTLEHLDAYLEQAATSLSAAGVQVHWAMNGAEANAVVLDIARQHNVKTIAKVKSMATEEIALNTALQAAGFQITETDLGEFIIQLAGLGPSHIVVPAVHLKKEEIAQLFKEKLGVEAPPDPEQLTAIARARLREVFLAADMGISGANFLVAETGTLVMVTNEGNGRMCTTLPDLHVAVVAIDKVVPDWESLATLLKLLARSATGQKLSTYTNFITGPRKTKGEHGPRELHVVLLDNGRSRMLASPLTRETLKCIRCGSCLNVCPVYKQVGGYAYGWFISGPIGAVLTPQLLGTKIAAELPYASTLCGACAEVCPVKVPLLDLLRHLRRRVAEGDATTTPIVSPVLRGVARGSAIALGTPWLYRLGARLMPLLQVPVRRGNWIPSLPAPLNRWTMVRPFMPFRARFRRWWKHHKKNE
ncbi:MAG: Lactate utilization protein B [Chloroflexi bacterium ADurb.Bin360]|nr:MAG: Lactate utilization protein B [Chloroflexi bacterium ADurb.Bin360]